MGMSWDQLPPEQQRAEWQSYRQRYLAHQDQLAQHSAPQPFVPAQWVPPAGLGPQLQPELPAKRPANVWGIVAMVTACLSLAILPVFLAVVGIVCALVGDVLEHRATGRNSKLCIAALVIAAGGVVLSQVVL